MGELKRNGEIRSAGKKPFHRLFLRVPWGRGFR